MKRSILQGICLSASVFLLLSLDGRAAETVTKETQSVASEELMTAGVENLFISTLSVDEYKALAEQAKGAMWGYTNLGLCNVQENNLNIRETPDESGRLVGKLPKDAACEVLESEDGWAHITSGKVEGYVKEEYLLTGYNAKKKGEELASTVAVASSDGLNIREQPDTGADVVTQVAEGEELQGAELYNDQSGSFWMMKRFSFPGIMLS